MKFEELKSNLSPYIIGCINEFESNGHCIVNLKQVLFKFDKFIVEFDLDNDTFTYEQFYKFLNSYKEREVSTSTIGNMVTLLRKLSVYMISIGKDAYLIPYDILPKRSLRERYIPTRSEIIRFIKFIDSRLNTPTGKTFYYSFLSESIVTRLLYLCGLRVSEALYILKKDVLLSSRLLCIRHSKGDNDRKIPITNEITSMLIEYNNIISKKFPDREYFFVNNHGEKIAKTSFDAFFRINWKRCFPDLQANEIPTPHSLRHAYCVDIINSWERNNIDFKTKLPLLSKFLGHKQISHTFYYYNTLRPHGQAIKNYIMNSGKLAEILSAEDLDDENI